MKIETESLYTVKTLNSGHLRVLKNLSIIESCSLLGGKLSKLCPLFGMSAIGRFHCMIKQSTNFSKLWYLFKSSVKALKPYQWAHSRGVLGPQSNILDGAFLKIGNSWNLLNIFAKRPILDAWQCSKYAPVF